MSTEQPLPHESKSTSNKDGDGFPIVTDSQSKNMIPRRGPIRFGAFDVTSQVFHTTPHTFALVNLKPLLPGHILVCPLHPTKPQPNHPSAPPSRLTHLPPHTTTSLFSTVQSLLPTLTRLYHASGFNIAIQDGPAAGQTVPHVHVHVIPRREGDMEGRGGGDRVYEMMEGEEGDLAAHLRGRKRFSGPDVEEGRRARSEEEMRVEAEWLRRELERDGVVSTDE